MSKAAQLDALWQQLRAVALAPDGAAPVPAPAPAAQRLAFEELWEPRTAQNGVFGVVTSMPLRPTADNSDPEQPFVANNITGKWGTLAGMDGSTSLPNITGLSSPCWAVANNELRFHARAILTPAAASDGFALISRERFDHGQRLVTEAELLLTTGANGAFVELCLVAGEGDYRGICVRRIDGKDYVRSIGPWIETTLCPLPTAGWNKFRLEYHPASGWTYSVNGNVVGTEALSHKGAALTARPHVGLYFANVIPGTYAEGGVRAVRVWEGG